MFDLVSGKILIVSIETRCKSVESLRNKVAEPTRKYSNLTQIRDLLAARIITLYEDDVNRAGLLEENAFEIDWGTLKTSGPLMTRTGSGTFRSITSSSCRLPNRRGLDTNTIGVCGRKSRSARSYSTHGRRSTTPSGTSRRENCHEKSKGGSRALRVYSDPPTQSLLHSETN